ncbi:MAG: YCF48-related protein [Bacteroidota bacterium]|nr:YCF48-related protein [Bacteroidota bacterium]
MKTIKVILTALIFLLSVQIHSQTFQWRVLPNSPLAGTSLRFEDIYFIDPNTGWIINFINGVYKTTNGGNTWGLITDSTFAYGFRSIGFFDANTGIFGTLYTDSNNFLYKTTNGGSNWAPVTNVPSPQPEGICGISIVNENIGFACGRFFDTGRIIKTTDKGVSWELVFNDSSLAKTLIDCYFWTADSGIAVGGYSTNNNFEVGNAVVIKTTNGGTSWQRVHKTTRTGEWCWKIHFINRQVGYVSIEKYANPTFILKTVNGGNSWQEISLPTNITNLEGIGFLNENTGWVGGWGTNYSFPSYETTNGGSNWHLAGWGINVNRFRFLNDTLAYAVGDRVYKYSREPVGIHNISNEIPGSFSLFQNYPNPFNPVTKIKFDVTRDVRSETQDIKLLVFDVLGKEVVTLVNEKLPPGSYEVELDGGNFTSGVYFYRISAEANGKSTFIETRRMILLR